MADRVKEDDTMTTAFAVENEALRPFVLRQQDTILIGVRRELDVIARNYLETFAVERHERERNKRRLEGLIADFLFFQS